LSKEKKLSTT